MTEKITRYRYWDILDEVPAGWKVITRDSPLFEHFYVIDGGCPFTSTKRALIHISNIKQSDKIY